MKKIPFLLWAIFLLVLVAGCSGEEHLWRIFDDQDHAGYIDSSGDIIVKPRFERAMHFSGGYAAVRATITNKQKKAEKLWGFINAYGYQAIPFKFASVGRFSEGLCAVMLSNRWGFIDESGDIEISPRFQRVEPFSEGRAAVLVQGKWGFIDKAGKSVVVPKYAAVDSFSEGLAAVKSGYLWGYINRDGKIVISPQFVRGGSFSEGLAFVRKTWQGKAGWINRDGKTRVEKSVDDAGKFGDGLVPVLIKGKWGYMDKHGALAIPATFQTANDFSGGLAAVQTNRKWGHVNQEGKYVLEPTNEYVTDFRDGVAGIYNDGIKYFVKKSGKVIFKFAIPRVGVYNRYVENFWNSVNETITIRRIKGKYKVTYWGYRRTIYGSGSLPGHFVRFTIRKNLFSYAFQTNSSGEGFFSPRGEYLSVDRNEDRAKFWLYKIDRDAY